MTKNNRNVSILIALVAVLFIINVVVAGIRNRKTSMEVEVQTLRDIAELATVEYRIKKLIYTKESSLLGDRRLLLEAPVIIKAGIDLNKITQDKIEIQGESIKIQMPYPELLETRVVMKNIRELLNNASFLRCKFDPEEKLKWLSFGQQKVLALAKEKKIDIFKMSREKTDALVTSWLRMIGYKKVEIIFQEAEAPKEDRNNEASKID